MQLASLRHWRALPQEYTDKLLSQRLQVHIYYVLWGLEAHTVTSVWPFGAVGYGPPVWLRGHVVELSTWAEKVCKIMAQNFQKELIRRFCYILLGSR